MSLTNKKYCSNELDGERPLRFEHRFLVLRKLGQGTYGKVQLALNKETNEEVSWSYANFFLFTVMQFYFALYIYIYFLCVSFWTCYLHYHLNVICANPCPRINTNIFYDFVKLSKYEKSYKILLLFTIRQTFLVHFSVWHLTNCLWLKTSFCGAQHQGLNFFFLILTIL